MRSRILETFFNLAKIDSPTGHEREIAQFLVSFLKSNELVDTAEIDKTGNVFAKVKGEGESLFLTDHMDTVEPGQGVKPKIKGEYVVSSGDTILGADDKSSIAALLEALFILKEQQIVHRPLEILFTVSEEVGSVGALHFNYKKLKSKEGICFDASLPLGTLIIASPFYERFDVVIKGKSAHSSRPELGVNALLVLKEVLSSLDFGKVDSETVFNIGVVNGGYVRNSIPESITLNGEIRSFSEVKLNKQKTKLIKVLDIACKKFGATYTQDFFRESPGYKFSSQKVKELSKVAEPIFNKFKIDLNLYEYWGCSDVNVINSIGPFCYSIGGGREFAHTKQERVKIKDLETLSKIMVDLLRTY